MNRGSFGPQTGSWPFPSPAVYHQASMAKAGPQRMAEFRYVSPPLVAEHLMNPAASWPFLFWTVDCPKFTQNFESNFQWNPWHPPLKEADFTGTVLLKYSRWSSCMTFESLFGLNKDGRFLILLHCYNLILSFLTFIHLSSHAFDLIIVAICIFCSQWPFDLFVSHSTSTL